MHQDIPLSAFTTVQALLSSVALAAFGSAQALDCGPFSLTGPVIRTSATGRASR